MLIDLSGSLLKEYWALKWGGGGGGGGLDESLKPPWNATAEHLRQMVMDSKWVSIIWASICGQLVGLSLIRIFYRFDNRQNYYRSDTSIRFSESNSK